MSLFIRLSLASLCAAALGAAAPPAAGQPAEAAPPTLAEAAPGPATPTEAVAGFYRALGRGDGIAAAGYLVPEKRGRGPFSAAAMQAFYGALRSPLVLRSVEEVGPQTVRARYAFQTRAGGACDGEAIVRVRAEPDGLFIQHIRALSGC
jgi:hypothetical protein